MSTHPHAIEARPLNRKELRDTLHPSSDAKTQPVCARIGNLILAREHKAEHRLAEAWEETMGAIRVRPYHPEAYLLLAEIALEAGDGFSARACAKGAREMAPRWSAPKHFLKQEFEGGAKPYWLELPPSLDGDAIAAPRVSVCLITKNEEQWLPGCLKSVRDIASEIIVIDTGSSDRTVEIAREFGAQVHHFEWSDDFSAARNASLEHATGDWILYIDADEELMAEHAATLKAEIRDPAVMAYRLRIFNFGQEQLGWGYVPRLFRNSPGIHFIGRIHEQAFFYVQELCKGWGLRNELAKTAILHHGYTEEFRVGRNKVQRNLRLLEIATKERPNDPNLAMNHGVELVRSGNLEAGIERYWQAFRMVSGRSPSDTPPEWREALLTQLATHLMAAQRYSDIIELWSHPFCTHGGMTAAQHFSLGVALMRCQKPQEATRQIRECLAKRHRTTFTPTPPELQLAGPHHCLALCAIALDDVAGAQRAFVEALTAEPGARAARFDYARFLAGLGKMKEALSILEGLARENPMEARVWELGGQIVLSRGEHLEFGKSWSARAVECFPETAVLLNQRAEVLLLTGDAAQSLEFWKRARGSSNRHRAAKVVCEVLTGVASGINATEEADLSAETVQWYLRFIQMGAMDLIAKLHGRIEALQVTLPTFVKVLTAAHQKAQQAQARD
jgi:tetratricopeptide (TPR) repeat protein